MNRNPEYVEVNGRKYKINTNFKYAIECDRIAKDETIGDTERALAIIYTLYGEKGLENQDDYEKLLKLALKYLSCGKEIVSDEKPDMDFIQDYNLIWTSFISDYNGLDIDKTDIHWWRFIDLMDGLSNSELGNCCLLNRVRNLRNFDTKDIKDPKELQRILDAKEKVALKKNIKLTDKQEESVNDFWKNSGF